MMEEQVGLMWGLPSDRRPESSSSTPYESAACSPSRSADAALSCFFSASTPTSPVKVTLDIDSLPSTGMGFVMSSASNELEEPASEEFDFSARFSETGLSLSSAPMSSADELFCNGQIRPLWFTSGDSALWYSNSTPLEHNDDEGHFDFQSSADYKFTMLSLSLTHISAMSKLRQYVDYDCGGQSHDRMCLHGPVNDLSMDDAIDKGARMQKTAESLPTQGSRQCDSNTTAKSVVKIKVEESRGRRVGGTKEGGIRRTRSLSPMRVFHMDDELPKQSFEARQCSQPAKEDCHSIEQEEKWERVEMARRKGGRMTLKELLHASEQAEQAVFSKGRSRTRSKQQGKAQIGTTLHVRSTLWSKSSLKHSLQNNVEVPNHSLHVQGLRSPKALHFSSPRFQSEQTRQQTFLPYRHGLLGCLGFTSKSYRSVAGFRSMHSKSQGTR